MSELETLRLEVANLIKDAQVYRFFPQIQAAIKTMYALIALLEKQQIEIDQLKGRDHGGKN